MSARFEQLRPNDEIRQRFVSFHPLKSLLRGVSFLSHEGVIAVISDFMSRYYPEFLRIARLKPAPALPHGLSFAYGYENGWIVGTVAGNTIRLRASLDMCQYRSWFLLKRRQRIAVRQDARIITKLTFLIHTFRKFRAFVKQLDIFLRRLSAPTLLIFRMYAMARVCDLYGTDLLNWANTVRSVQR